MPRLGVPSTHRFSAGLAQPAHAPLRLIQTKRCALHVFARNLRRTDPRCRGRTFPTKTIDRTVLSRVSTYPVLTPKKGRKEGISVATELTEGAKAPAFDLPRDGGGRVSLKDFKGKKLVIYFYPKADTPGCTKESIDFSKLHAEFRKAGTDILGVSADPVAAQDKF